MVDEKGLSPECAHKIGQYVVLSGKKIINPMIIDTSAKNSFGLCS